MCTTGIIKLFAFRNATSKPVQCSNACFLACLQVTCNYTSYPHQYLIRIDGSSPVARKFISIGQQKIKPAACMQFSWEWARREPNRFGTDMDHSAVYIQKTNDPMQQHVGVEGDASITWYVPSEENAWQHELCHSIQTRENTTADRDVGCCMANFYPILQLDWIQREINYKGGYGLSCMILVLSSCDLSRTQGLRGPSKVGTAVD